MKGKAISKKITVKNKAFVKAVKKSMLERTALHEEIVEKAKKSGILKKLASAQ
jgi:hypothetical protein